MISERQPLWYAVHTHPREEQKALNHLRRQQYCVYLPSCLKTVRHARKSEQVIRPFFPRYLFVQLDVAIEGWRSIRSTVGVADIVSFGNRPTPLPAGVIEALQAQEDGDGYIHFVDQPSLKLGDAVEIVSGPFASQFGLCAGSSDKERVAILLDLLGRKVRVMLDLEAVEAA